MLINRNKWHYRLMKKLDFNIPTNLCPYMWKTVAAMLAVLVLTILTPVCAVMLLMMIFGGFFTTELALPSMAAWSILGAAFYLLARECRTKDGFWCKARYITSQEPAEEGTFSHFVKEQHSKMCPTLEFTDEIH